MKVIGKLCQTIFVFLMSFGLMVASCNPISTNTLVTDTPSPTDTPLADLMITMQRTACHGTCPVYQLTIHGDGTVIYNGQRFVAVEGQQTISLSQDQMKQLVSAFDDVGFFSFHDYIANNAGDSQSVITSITINGKTKKVIHYYGDNNAPKGLFDLESRIDQITNSKQWINGYEGVVVTIRVAGIEQYKIRLTDPADIEIARRLLAGDTAPRIPNGIVVRGDPDVNTGYSWHIDPSTVEFADVTTEVCDGLPSDVEKGLVTSDYYCPWSAEVIAIDER